MRAETGEKPADLLEIGGRQHRYGAFAGSACGELPLRLVFSLCRSAGKGYEPDGDQ